MNNIEWFTKSASYKLVSFIICAFLFGYFCRDIGNSRDELIKLETTLNAKEEILKTII
jgi:hypothetical protein